MGKNLRLTGHPAVMVAKFTADYISRDGIYESRSVPSGALLEALLTLPYTAIRLAWINLRHYPFLNNKADYRRDEVLARHVMTPAADLECLTDEGWTVSRIGAHLLLGLPSLRALRSLSTVL